ncbi:hypothetical protein K469DRAFT_693090 [Zopfia rhizophila CBS 207.26]|uniref:Elongation factor 1 alpha-like protein n=1 Tax=Zopfia rhizophila CBS 207.26 TaxID=1314779 RepID=A0A6A6EN59_9PEZI|nr:hypothetical protein K469DRAFT_693090 [Zopfia rhizophila CBS 207.26]
MPPKSGHHRAKNVDYEEDDVYSDDDYYENEEGGGMTDEDREQMRIGAIKVKEALNSSITVSDSQIQEALWHYYYDVGKSVTYLKNKHAPATTTTQPKKQKAVSRFDQAVSAASTPKKPETGEQSAFLMPPNRIKELCTAPSLKCTFQSRRANIKDFDTNTGASECWASAEYPCLYPIPDVMDHVPLSAAEFFRDTPWLNVPTHRLGEITVEPLFPRGGLLGGSSKPSKLAALAAARKKKQEEAKNATSTSTDPGDMKAEADKAVALLDRLSVKSKESASPSSALVQPQPVEQKSAQSKYPSRKRSQTPTTAFQESETPTPEPETSAPVEIPHLRAGPSMFASTLCGITPLPVKRQHLDSTSFPLPYTSTRGFTDTNPFTGPSPDDIVLSARVKGNKSKPGPNKKPNGNKLAESVEKLSVEEVPKVKSKNLNVVEEFEKSGMKRMANFVVIGHVDHGKSTLMGRLLYDLKVIDQRSVDKLRKEAETIGKSSFALAWIMDQTSEERSRGVTVDIATNYFETDKTRFTILDAPGHRDFIPNMIAGASQADFAVLVIDASTNSFESGLKGQTKEHALLVRSMGVQRLVVAVNKMDTVNWSQDRFEEISQQMTAFLTAASFSGKSITFIPCAGLTGENVTRKIEEGKASWYNGQTLIEALDASEPAKRSLEKPFRLTVSDVFRGSITNPVSIAGRIDAGSIQVGDTILSMPANEAGVIKGVEVENEPVDWAVAGQIATFHLAELDPVHLRLGDIICDPKKPVTLTKSFTAKILAFEHVLPMGVDVFRGRMSAEANVTKLVAVLNKGTGEVEKKKVRIVKPGEVARVVVQLDRELPLEVGVRVVLREGGNTVAAGLLEMCS